MLGGGGHDGGMEGDRGSDGGDEGGNAGGAGGATAENTPMQSACKGEKITRPFGATAACLNFQPLSVELMSTQLNVAVAALKTPTQCAASGAKTTGSAPSAVRGCKDR